MASQIHHSRFRVWRENRFVLHTYIDFSCWAQLTASGSRFTRMFLLRLGLLQQCMVCRSVHSSCELEEERVFGSDDSSGNSTFGMHRSRSVTPFLLSVDVHSNESSFSSGGSHWNLDEISEIDIESWWSREHCRRIILKITQIHVADYIRCQLPRMYMIELLICRPRYVSALKLPLAERLRFYCMNDFTMSYQLFGTGGSNVLPH